MDQATTGQRVREALSVLGALAIGPLVLAFGYSQRFMFGVAALYYFLVCAAIVPLLTFAGGRLKFVVWQLAVLDLALSVVGDDLRGGMRMHARELLGVVYGFWFMGTLLSSPLPVYFILVRLPRRRLFVGILAIGVITAALFLGGWILIR
jgi:hypothetical protein